MAVTGPKMRYCAAARLVVERSSEAEKGENTQRRLERMGHSLPAFDKAR
jgi:hypothetical protein